MTTLELHVWGPAFGLPSIDAECIAAIAYFSSTLSPSDYELVQSSPSAVPTHHLPALHDPSTGSWVAGFHAIVTHLESHVAPISYRSPISAISPHHETPPSPSPSQLADAVAYSAYLTSHAAPLLALSLYVSSANWAAATRPAYSQILPFPLAWTEPSAVRAAMAARADHLGLSSLDADATAAREKSAEDAAAAAGWAQVPASLRKNRGSGGPRTALNPEQAARIRLDGLASDVLDVLSGAGELLFPRSGGGEDGGDGDPTTTATGRLRTPLQCLAFGYLSLILVPDVPRPWLREALCSPRYARLHAFVDTARRESGPAWRTLPRRAARGPQDSAPVVAARFALGAARDVPPVGEALRRWWWRQRGGSRRKDDRGKTTMVGMFDNRLHHFHIGAAAGLVGFSCCCAAAGAAGAWLWLYCRSWPPLGAPVQRFEAPARFGLHGLGAAGAVFGAAAAVADFGGVRYGN